VLSSGEARVGRRVSTLDAPFPAIDSLDDLDRANTKTSIVRARARVCAFVVHLDAKAPPILSYISHIDLGSRLHPTGDALASSKG